MDIRFPACVVLTVALSGGAVWSATDAPAGKAVYDQWCAGCHDPTAGLDRAGTLILRLRYKDAKPAALEERTDLTPAYVKIVVRNGRNFMPRTRKTEINEAQLDALADYLGKAK
jgi:mono/diheme cytochrome c family protein